MVDIVVRNDAITLDEPLLVEGLPGIGLVGTIAAAHLVDHLDLEYYADLRGEGIPRTVTFTEDQTEVKSPVRLYASDENDLVVLQGDTPVSVMDAPGFAETLADWIADQNATPLFIAGYPAERELDVEPDMYGVATGDGADFLGEMDVTAPEYDGIITGPAGALLQETRSRPLDAVGLIVETSPQFPDPQGARKLIDHGVEPLSGVEVDTEPLVEQADEIIERREQLAQQIQQAEPHESNQAGPIGFE